MIGDEALDNRQHLEDVLVFFAHEIGEVAFERYISGDLSQEEFEQAYRSLKNWTQETEKLLKLRL